MRIIVQKFGGSSVASPAQRQQVVKKIISAVQEGYSPVVVVSAMGRKGDPYATDTFIGLVKEITSDYPAREMDILMSCGEIISAAVMVATLRKMGYESCLLTGRDAGIITDKNFGDARIIKVLPQRIFELLQEKKIVVVTGFQGVTEDGDITTLGRGGSDTTACALGVALDAEVIDIYTDVEGIMTADPRIVEDAKLLDTVTYNEICQLAHQGAKVIHPRAVEIAMQKNIPVRVRSTFSDHPGTLVSNLGGGNELGTDIRNDRLVTGITQIPNITQIRILTREVSEPAGLELKIFKAMALAGISVDFINVTPEAVLFTVKEEQAEKAVQILQNMNFIPQVRHGCAKVSVVGAGMAGIPGVMAAIVEALTREGIQILQSSDSHTTIWCLVEREDMERAVRALHQQFKLGQ
ncbi:MAG: aspartate kinase [Firmicutes bacterium]|nr:aspartate kinase [Bacillota bacterium]